MTALRGAALAEAPPPEADGAAALAPLRDDFVRRFAAGGLGEALETFLDAPREAALEAWLGPGGSQLPADVLRRRLDADLAALDAALSRAVNAILRHSRMQALEAAWRGVAWLASGLGADGSTVLRLLDARWAEIARDAERAAEFDQSALFDKIYNQEFGLPGGIPYSLLIGLYEIRHRPGRGHPVDDVAALRRVSGVAAAAFAPFVAGVHPALLGVDRFGELDLRQSLSATFRLAEYARFQALQALPDSRYLALVAPRILLRGPRLGRAAGDCGFRYEPDSRDHVWGSGALAVAHLCIRAFGEHRWPAAIRGTVRDRVGGGVVADLPRADFQTDAPGTALKFQAEVNISEKLEREAGEAGLIVLRRVKDTPYLAVYSLPSLHRPRGALSSEAARVNEQLGGMLNHMLCVCRFAHYVKVIGRDWIGAFRSADDCEARLQRWLNRFTSGGDQLSFEDKARYPLADARIHVTEAAGRPGSYECVLHLRPHFQLDQAVSEFQLVTLLQDAGRPQ